jgi:hypothetical protein
MRNQCPGSQSVKEARPEYVRCPHCGGEVEVWTDEVRGRCSLCNAWVYREQGATCLDWCQQAEQCVGLSALAAYRHAREAAR